MTDKKRLGEPLKLTEGQPVPKKDAISLSDGWKLNKETVAAIKEIEASVLTTSVRRRATRLPVPRGYK